MDIADQVRQIGFIVHQEEKIITVKSKWFCSVIANLSSSDAKFEHKFGKMDRNKAIILSLLIFSLIILFNIGSTILPFLIFLFVISLTYDGIRYIKTQKIQKVIEGFTLKE